MATATSDLIADARDSFRGWYTTYLRDHLDEAAQQGTLDELLEGAVDGEGQYITASLMNSADEYAYSRTREEYQWRLGDAFAEAFSVEDNDELYDPVDFDKLIADAKRVQ